MVFGVAAAIVPLRTLVYLRFEQLPSIRIRPSSA